MSNTNLMKVSQVSLRFPKYHNWTLFGNHRCAIPFSSCPDPLLGLPAKARSNLSFQATTLLRPLCSRLEKTVHVKCFSSIRHIRILSPTMDSSSNTMALDDFPNNAGVPANEGAATPLPTSLVEYTFPVHRLQQRSSDPSKTPLVLVAW